jgi:predicted AAA+ superfamily ATPase
VNIEKGKLFEHAVILEIIRRIRTLALDATVHFWRTSGGAEVDCILDFGDEVIPIEIKASARVSLSELKGLQSFLDSYPKQAKRAYVVTMGQLPERLTANITAIPWNHL